MTQRLIYVIGPSGAGKDSVLQGLREAWGNMPTAHWAQRTITREPQAGGEAHESVSEGEFQRLLKEGAFTFQWHANGLSYGVRRSELAPLAAGECVFVNGSRAFLSQFLTASPLASVVHITASPAVLQQRLLSRQRENKEEIAKRLLRSVDVALPPQTLHIQNDGALNAAVQALRNGLAERLCAV